MKTALLAACAGLLFAGCASVDTHEASDAHLERLRHIYVEHRLADGRGLDQLIAQELVRRGYDASAGPLTMAPRDAEAIVTYEDEWTFDFTTYLIKLDIRFRDARSARPLASAQLFRPSVIGKSPQLMIREVLAKLIKPRVPPVPVEKHDDAGLSLRQLQGSDAAPAALPA